MPAAVCDWQTLSLKERPLTLPLRALVLFALAGCLSVCASAERRLYGSAQPMPDLIVDSGGAPNNAHAMKQHYVVLVSLDGFR